MFGCAGYINGDETLLAGRDAERWGVCGEARGMWEEIGDSDTGNGAGDENGEVVVGNVEGPASVLGTGIPTYVYEACLIDSSIAFANSSSSCETFPERSFDSFSERAIASASASSSSSTGACLTSSWNLGGEPAGYRGRDGMGGGGGGTNKGGALVSYGET